MSTALDILKKYWKYDTFREPQAEIIQHTLARKNSIVLLPTGSGKSICYQIPAMIMKGVCIVVSPLIALMHDQVRSLKDKSIKAIALTSQLNKDETIIAFDNLQFGNYSILYLSPEKLDSEFILEKIKQLNVGLIAVDEAHCISEWGHDFRPSYLKLHKLCEIHPEAPVLALTATATKRVVADIRSLLKLEDAALFKTSFHRPNLNFQIVHTENTYQKLISFLKALNGSAIVYTNRRKTTRTLADVLIRNQISCSSYHGGLSSTEKEKAYAQWSTGNTQVMVATNAFGMGIDKQDVRAVLHLHLPESIENYVQEAGRAGRDGKSAEAILFTNQTLIADAIHRFKTGRPTLAFLKTVYNHLNQYFGIAQGETPEGNFSFDPPAFAKTYDLPILQTYNAVRILSREGVFSLNENYSRKSTLKLIIDHHYIYGYMDRHPNTEKLLQLILRSYGGIFDHPVTINEFGLAGKLGVLKATVVTMLKQLQQDEIVAYTDGNNATTISYLQPREDNVTINRIADNVLKQENNKKDKLKALLEFVENNDRCRNVLIAEYFGDEPLEKCGHCDNCSKNKGTKVNYRKAIVAIESALLSGPKSSNELATVLNIDEKDLIISLKILLEKDKIAITSQHLYKLNK